MYYFFYFYFYFILLYNTVLVLPYIDMNPHGCTCIPKHEPPSHLPPHNISLGHRHAPAPSMLYPASDIDWRFDSYMIVYTLQCHSPKSSHPLPCHCLFSCQVMSDSFATPWTVAHQAPLSMGFSRQEYWSGVQLSPPGESFQPRDQTRISCIAGRFFSI